MQRRASTLRFRSLPLSLALDEEEAFLACLGEGLLSLETRARITAVQVGPAVYAPLPSQWAGTHAYC